MLCSRLGPNQEVGQGICSMEAPRSQPPSIPTLGPVLLSFPNAMGTFSHGGEVAADCSPLKPFLLLASTPAPYLTAEAGSTG